ncbi:MAG: hypothetical protein PHY42_04290 [Bacilli bacterium]|nr:hypothetical protein [Bacilli bacterium]
MQKERFLELLHSFEHDDSIRRGIGTYQESFLHCLLKYTFEANEGFHEVKIDSYVADIFDGKQIIEIQTGNFNQLRGKLTAFLPKYPVLLVYPIAHIKWIRWEDPETGELCERRKSPKVGSLYDCFKELYKIKWFLSHPQLSFCLVLIDLEETRLLNGWSKDHKKGSHRKSRMPIELYEATYFNSKADYERLIPSSLAPSFTVKDFSKAAKLTLRRSGEAISVLKELKLIVQSGKIGRAYTYSKGEENNGHSSGLH